MSWGKKTGISELEVLNQYSTIRHRVEKALKPLLFNLPHMIPTPDLHWTGDVRKELSTASSSHKFVNMYVSSEHEITVSVNTSFGINDDELILLYFSEKYFSAWLGANS